MIPLRASRTTILPLAREAEVVGALSANVVVAEVIIEVFCVRVGLSAVDPETDQGGFVRGVRDRGWLLFRGGSFGCGGSWFALDPHRLWGRRGGGCCGHYCEVVTMVVGIEGSEGGQGAKEG